MRCEHCGGAIIHEEESFPNPPRDYCFSCGREPKSTVAETSKSDDRETMSNRLNSEKEKEVKGLLETHSIREIFAKTGVAKNTIAWIRNENFTKEEKAELKKRANVKGRNRRELKKEEPKTTNQRDAQIIFHPKPTEIKGGQQIMAEQTQVCTNPKCPKPNPQPIDEFNKNAARPSGRESRCRTCTAQAQRDRKASIGKSSGGTGRSRKAPGNGRRKRQPKDSGPRGSRSPQNLTISDAVTLDAQLLRAVKKSAILDFVKNDLPRIVEETFA